MISEIIFWWSALSSLTISMWHHSSRTTNISWCLCVMQLRTTLINFAPVSIILTWSEPTRRLPSCHSMSASWRKQTLPLRGRCKAHLRISHLIFSVTWLRNKLVFTFTNIYIIFSLFLLRLILYDGFSERSFSVKIIKFAHCCVQEFVIDGI